MDKDEILVAPPVGRQDCRGTISMGWRLVVEPALPSISLNKHVRQNTLQANASSGRCYLKGK
jgi:hypothetical protein